MIHRSASDYRRPAIADFSDRPLPCLLNISPIPIVGQTSVCQSQPAEAGPKGVQHPRSENDRRSDSTDFPSRRLAQEIGYHTEVIVRWMECYRNYA